MDFNQIRWVGTWVSAQQLTEPSNLPPLPGLSNNTLRQIIRVTIGGNPIRLRLSNEYGKTPLGIHVVSIAASRGGSSIDTSTNEVFTFNERNSLSIPPGQCLWSDPLDFFLTPLTVYAVSIYFGDVPREVTGHPASRTTSYLQTGNAAAETTLSGSETEHWYILSGIDIAANDSHAAVVTLGDSLTDGRGSTTNGNNRWPDILAERLQAHGETKTIAVLNQGMGANAVISGGLGPVAVSRFERDVIDQHGAKWCIVLEGVNDIGGSVPAVKLIKAYEEMINKAHTGNILIYGATILPFGGSQYDSPDREAVRQEVNHWIRMSKRFDAVIDLERAVQDPLRPNCLAPEYDCGDHLHLSPAGYKKLGYSIPLSLFHR